MSKTFLNCSQKLAFFTFLLIGVLFIAVGCAGFYKALGFTDQQITEQIAQDREAIKIILEQGRWTAHEIITTTLAGLGTILSGFLAKWLGTERKITSALITGVEAGDVGNVKETIKNKATAAGVEPILHRRVIALT